MSSRNWIWSTHLQFRISKRKISKELIEKTINSPDEIVKSKQTRLIYQKVIGNKLVRVVTEGDTLVTAYMTSKIKKYMRGKQ